MNILTKVTFTFSALLVGAASFAQNPIMNDQAKTATDNQSQAVNSYWKPTLVEDGIIDRVEHDNALLPIHKIREIDIAWKATVWRIIDIKQKQNMAFRYTGDQYTGGGAFIEILNDAVSRGKINAYSNVDDRFTTPLDMAAFKKQIGGDKDTTWVTDPITGEPVAKIHNNYFNVNSVTSYEVKEEWIFDRNRGHMVVQIVGIAPLQDVLDPMTGQYVSSSPMYWLYYPDLRKILANYEVYNPRNDMRRMTWTDFLDGHYYESYVMKTSMNNPLGGIIPDQHTLQALYQGQKELNNIIHREMDMWEE